MATTLDMHSIASLILANGDRKSYVIRGEPGIGKSAILKLIGEKLKDTHIISYIDAATLSLGDLALPHFVQAGGTTVTEFAPNARFGFQYDKPMVIMVDEIGKAPQEIRNMLLPIMYEHRFGNTYLKPGSFTFATTNLRSDGLGDSIKAHEKNRMTLVNMRKPTSKEWIFWGLNNSAAPEVLAWVEQYEHCFASYTDTGGKVTNPYIYDPKNASQEAFVSPRSLELASIAINNRHKYSREALLVDLAGTIGEAAAKDMTLFVEVTDKLPARAEIYADPKRCPVPDDTTARLVLCYSLGASVKTGPEIEACLTYLSRLPAELYAMWLRSVQARTEFFGKVATRNAKFMSELTANAKLL